MDFIKGQRKKTLSDIRSLRHLRHLVGCQKETLSRPDEILMQIDEGIEELEKKLAVLPVGHRYDGEFYFRKKNTNNEYEYHKRSGALFMQESLITWEAADRTDASADWRWLRYFFKDPSCEKILQREDGQPVFEEIQTAVCEKKEEVVKSNASSAILKDRAARALYQDDWRRREMRYAYKRK